MRKNQAPKRIILPDIVFNSQLVSKAINKIMWEGKKNLAQKIFYEALEMIKEKLNEEPIKVFHAALDNIYPTVELRVRRIAGSNYQVPTEISQNRKESLALRWLILFSRKRNEKTMIEKLANEIIDASKGHGASVKKRNDTIKTAESNKAFTHLRY